ncbi:MAG: UvrD-helicase domain-containing protein [Abditibacteriota bacterium]|nr:UvrD-helicase domain-containing protein [Abditibacteriota bacterium]
MSDVFAIDELIRKRIKEETDTNFFVEASAGSGKTTSLVGRMVSMVKHGVPIEKICAITFTKAAANEFYSRFRDKLAEESVNAENEESERALCAEALKNIDLCFMGTIDSFCHTVIGEHPMEAGLPSDADILSDTDLLRCRRREYLNAMRGGYGEETERLCEGFTASNKKADQLFDGSIEAFASTRHLSRKIGGEYTADKRKQQQLYFLLRNLCEEHFSPEPSPAKIEFHGSTDRYPLEGGFELRLGVYSFTYIAEHRNDFFYISARSKNKETGQPDMPQAVRKAYTALQKKISVLDSDWSENAEDVVKFLKEIGGREVNKKTGAVQSKGLRFMPHTMGFFKNTGLEEFVVPRESRGKVVSLDLVIEGTDLYNCVESGRYRKTLMFFDDFAEKSAETLRKRGEMGYFDYLYYLREMLRKDAETGGKLIRRIRARRNRFLIDEFQDTDPLQAEIFFYLSTDNPNPNWRECVPERGSLFIVGDPKQSIYRFRGADIASYGAVRKIFAESGGEVVSLSRNFRSQKPLTTMFNRTFSKLMQPMDDHAVGFEEIPEENKPAVGMTGVYKYDCEPKTDPEDVARLILSLLGKPIREGEETRPAAWRDFMVITYRKTHMDKYIAAFDKYNIPVREEGVNAFDRCPVFRAACFIIAAAFDPKDTLSEYGALRSGAFALSEEDILRGTDACVEAKNLIADYGDTLRNLPLGAAVEETVERFDLIDKLGTTDFEYIRYAAELIRAAEKRGDITSMGECVNFLKDMLEGKQGDERCLTLSEKENRVHIANLHKVKGLEAPIVILPSAAEKTLTRMVPLYHRSKDSIYHFGLLGLGKFKNSYSVGTAAFEEQKRREELACDAEELRLLYVAATRARDVLIIADNDKSPWTRLVKYAEERMAKSDAAAPEPESETPPPAVIPAEFNTEASYQIVRPSKVESEEDNLRSLVFDESEPADLKEEASDTDAALRGTMVHELMEVLVSSRGRIDDGAAVGNICRKYDGAKYESLLLRVAHTIRHGGYEQTNGLPADILGELADAEEVLCEVPFCRKDGSDIHNGTVDLLYRKDGKWHIVDYKTNRSGVGLDKQYGGQLKEYEKAFDDENIKAKIYHIDLNLS